jgi:beta-lactam-binding protein with PASTA domain
LIIDFQFDRQDPGFQHEDVVSIEPAAGTAVKRGSTVKVTVNLEG